MRLTSMRVAWVIFGLAVLPACGTKRPVLYPNAHLNHVGKQVAESDIDDCMQFAADHGLKPNPEGKVAGQTAGGAAVGAASGAAVGAVLGSAGRGAAVGAAGGGAGGFMRGIFSSRDPDPVLRRFVEKCLREKGYEPIGWR